MPRKQQDEGFKSCDVGKSTAIAAIDYDPYDGNLAVTFTSGKAYKYFGVSHQRYNALCNAESKGAYFSKNIRNRYNFRRLG